MKRYIAVVIVITMACWIAEGMTNWSWPIGATGTVIGTFGMAGAAFGWWIRHQANLTAEQYERDYLDRKVEQHRDGNIIG